MGKNSSNSRQALVEYSNPCITLRIILRAKPKELFAVDGKVCGYAPGGDSGGREGWYIKLPPKF